MGTKAVETVRQNMTEKSTDELLQIWKENDQEAWSEYAFEAVQQILAERRVDLPPQNAVNLPKVRVAPPQTLYRTGARFFAGLVILWWVLVIMGCILELTVSHAESERLASRLLPLFDPVLAFLVSCYWFVEVGRRELRQSFLLALGLICAVGWSFSIALSVSAIADVVLHKEGFVSDTVYVLVQVVPMVILGFLSYRLSFQRSES